LDAGKIGKFGYQIVKPY